MKRFLTILTILGCSFFASAQCEVTISMDSTATGLNLTANTINNMAVTFEWNTGETTQTINANPGTFDYCVIATFADGCIAETCFGDNPPTPDCSVNILTIQNGAWVLADPTGTAPFTYSWNTGETTSAIEIPQIDTVVCVTTTDADGCVATSCIDVIATCDVYISQQNTPIGTTYLNSSAYGNEPFVYSWSTGETTASITPTDFGTYCLTVTDATGCESENCYEYLTPTNCSVTVIGDGTGGGNEIQFSAAVSNAVFPIQYSWSTGETTEDIIVTEGGSYCVDITDAQGCMSSDCFTFFFPPTCPVEITEVITSAGETTLVANTTGAAPIQYFWSTGENTQAITPSSSGTYTVTVITGSSPNDQCSSSVQYYYEHPCGATVDMSGSNTTSMDLCAVATGAAPFTYLWSTGETTECINTNVTGTYSVTVTDANGCVSEVCCLTLQFIPPNYGLTGTIYTIDSINGPINLEGWVYRIGINPDGTASLIDSTEILTDPSGWSNYYDFGDVDAGMYIVKAALTEGSDNYETTLPTYHFNSLTWGAADMITVPFNGYPFYNISMVPGNNPGGPGGIYGSVIVGDGFVLDPIPNTSILLFDESENPMLHVLTDANGEFAFPSLPWGTYKVQIEIVGQEPAWYWVTIGPDTPTADGWTFEVSEFGITTDISEVLAIETFTIFPNPVTDMLTINFNATQTANVQISLTSITGQTVLTNNQQFTIGSQSIEMDVTNVPTGIYFLNIADGKDVISKKIVKH